MSIAVHFDRVSKVYKEGETVSGAVVVSARSGSLSHSGLTLQVDGRVAFQQSPKTCGVFEAFYKALQPLVILSLDMPLVESGKFPEGDTEIPFAFPLKSTNPKLPLAETYHGVYVSVAYAISATLKHSLSKKKTEAEMFYVMCPGQGLKNDPLPRTLADRQTFTMTSDKVRTTKRDASASIPQFAIHGHLDTTAFDFELALSGSITVDRCEVPIRSVEVQLVRVEAIAEPSAGGKHDKEVTEIQNIQIGDGDVFRGQEIPIHMMFPRWFTCPTLHMQNYRVDFNVNMIVVLETMHQVLEAVPLRLYRSR